LDYVRLGRSDTLRRALHSDRYHEAQRVRFDIAPVLAGIAWLLLLASYWRRMPAGRWTLTSK
jgi:hypothetical protein